MINKFFLKNVKIKITQLKFEKIRIALTRTQNFKRKII